MSQQIGIALGTPGDVRRRHRGRDGVPPTRLRVALGVNAGIAIGAAALIAVFLHPRDPSRRGA